MSEFIRYELRSGLLGENKLYGRKVIDTTTKRIGDSSEDTLNKLAIAGLFRDYFGNIQQLKSKEQLDSVFEKWYNGMLGEMVKTKDFAEDEENAKRYLDAYISNIRGLGDNAKRFSMKKIESGLVDLVNKNKWLESGTVSTKASIYEPDEDDIVYEDDDILILDSRTKAKCVKYGSGESWCIGKPELNYYNTYRLNYGATPYHVLQKNVEGNEHKLVIMNYGSRGYAIADRSNTGNRHGGPKLAMSWDNVESEIPNLKGMQKYFPYREITADELNYESLVNQKYNNDNLQRYIEDMTRDLVVNDSSVTPEDFIRDYVAQNHSISDRQIESLTDSVKDSLVESGYFLSRGENQTDLLNDKQIRRIIRLKLENGKLLTDNELNVIMNNQALLNKCKESLFSDDGIDLGYYLRNSEEKLYQYVKLFGKDAVLDKFGSYDLKGLIENSGDLVVKLFGKDAVFDKLGSYALRLLIEGGADLVIKLFGKDAVLHKLGSYGLTDLIKNSGDLVVNIFGKDTVFDKLDSYRLMDLIKDSGDLVVNIFGKDAVLHKLDSYDLRNLIDSFSTEKLIELFGFKNLFSKLDTYQRIEILIDNADNKDNIRNLIADELGTNLDEFESKNDILQRIFQLQRKQSIVGNNKDDNELDNEIKRLENLYRSGLFGESVNYLQIKNNLRINLLKEGEVIDEGFGEKLKALSLAALLGVSSPSMAGTGGSEKDPEAKVISTHEFGDITNQGMRFLRTHLGLDRPLKSLSDADFNSALSMIDDSLITKLNGEVDSLGYKGRIENVENAMNWVFAYRGNRIDGIVDKELLKDFIMFVKEFKGRQSKGDQEIKPKTDIKPTAIPYGSFKKK
jgi:hypothetical protein